VHGMTTSDRFAVSLTVLDGKYAQPVRRAGPFLDVGTRRYRMPPAVLAAVQAVENHTARPPERRTETRNVRLLAELQQSLDALAEDGATPSTSALEIDLRQLAGTRVIRPGRVGLLVDHRPDGGLAVQPDLGADIDPDQAA